MFIAITIHHHIPRHEQALAGFMDEVADSVADAPGLIDFKTCRDVRGHYLAGYSCWQSEHAFQAALPAIRAMAPARDPGWTDQPDETIRLVTV